MTISPISIATDGFIVPEGTGGEGGNSRSFVGSSSGVATTSAVLQVPTVIGMVGLSAGLSSASATLRRLVGLIGASDGVAATSAVLSPLQALSGSSAGVAVTSSILGVDFVLTGDSSGEAQTIGHMGGGTGATGALTLLVDPRHIDE